MNGLWIERSKGIEITGLGAVTPFGDNVEAFWQALTAGKNAFGPIRLFSAQGHRTHVAAGVLELPSLDLRRLDKAGLSRADHLALAAAFEALRHARLLDQSNGRVYASKRTGIVVGTAAGGILGLESFFRKRAFYDNHRCKPVLVASGP